MGTITPPSWTHLVSASQCCSLGASSVQSAGTPTWGSYQSGTATTEPPGSLFFWGYLGPPGYG